MPRTTKFSSMYGYARHPQDQDGRCMYCHETVDYVSWDYIPARDVMADPVTSKLITFQPHAVTACKRCKSFLYYVKFTALTFDDRLKYLMTRHKFTRNLDDVSRTKVEMALMPIWIGRYEKDGVKYEFLKSEDQIRDEHRDHPNIEAEFEKMREWLTVPANIQRISTPQPEEARIANDWISKARSTSTPPPPPEAPASDDTSWGPSDAD